MKSKPPMKKAKLDTTAASATSSGPFPTEGKPKPKILSSIKQEQGSSKASTATATTASEILGKIKVNTGSSIGNTVGGQAEQARLSFPIFPVPEIIKEFPRLFLASQSVKQEPDTSAAPQPLPNLLPMDEVDILQNELETLWSLIAIRTRTLQSESEILDTILSGQATIGGEHYDATHQEKINTVKNILDSGHGTRTSVSAVTKLVLNAGETASSCSKTVATPSSSTASIVVGSSRKSNNSAAAATSVSMPSPSCNRQPKKKLKAELGDIAEVSGYKPARAGQNRSHSVSMDDSFLRLEAPNQFWEFADSHCRDITQNDINDLEKELEEFREIAEATFVIPPLGKHFNEKKAVPETNGTASARLRDDKDLKSSKDVIGPLTEHLVTALVEDRIAQYALQPNNGDVNGAGNNDFHLIPRPGLVKALGLDLTGPGAQTPLEARLKMVLAEQGFILGDEADESLMTVDPEDEVLAEIKRTFGTLKKLHNHNFEKLEKLAVSAKTELIRQNRKRELEKADKEIIAAYRALAACRIKRKPITSKERSLATKALEYRQQAINGINSNENPGDLDLS